MKIKNILTNNTKRIVGAAMLLSLMAVQTVGAASTTADSIKSQGNIEYDSDQDGTAEVLFYSKDLTTIAEGVDGLNSNLVTLSGEFETLTDKSNEYKAGIINGLNGNVYKNDQIPSTATYEQIISKIENITAPTTALGKYYAGGDNTGIGIDDGVDKDVNIEDVVSVNLAVNESITLPSGYYPNGITIQNNVKNIGQLDWRPTSADTAYISPGYYSGGTLDSSAAYDEGYSAGFLEGDAAGYERGYSVGYEDGYGNLAKAQIATSTQSYSGDGASNGNGPKTFTYTPQYDGELQYTLIFTGDTNLITFTDLINGATIKSGTKDKKVVVGHVQAGVPVTIGKASYQSDDSDWRDNAKVTISYALMYYPE